jgi:formylglycine-generating enzyme required for sulfatase activity/serine/threonine protein kinase
MPTLADLPQAFGHFRILRKLGAGGMGTVYLAEDTQLGCRVALKLPLLSEGTDPKVVERFYREARLAKSIQHPYVCPVYEVGQLDGVHYLTMPLIEGQPLSRLVGPDRPWEPRRAADLVRRLALALQALHERGVIHRDLKPHNIMLRDSGEPMLMDFGLARAVGGEQQHLTATGQVLGTPAYMPPEQIEGADAALGPGADVYSLGVILFELLTGRRPFEAPRLMALFHKIQTEPAPPLSALRPGLDARLEAVCGQALAKRPAERHAGMAELAAELEAYLRDGSAEPASEPVGTVVGPAAELALACQQCGKPLRFLTAARGESFPCPSCQAQVHVPEALPDLGSPRKTDPPELHPVRQRQQPEPAGAERDTRPTLSPPRRRLSVAVVLFLGVMAVAGYLLGKEIVGSFRGPAPKAQRLPDYANKGPAYRQARGTPKKILSVVSSPVKPGTRAGEVVTLPLDGDLAMRFAWCPPGTFRMGSPKTEAKRDEDETPHRVTLTKGFYLGVHEVTQAQWKAVLGTNPSVFKGKDAGEEKKLPVENVSWFDCVEFCIKLSERKHRKPCYRLANVQRDKEGSIEAADVEFLAGGTGYRLPTEAEWEYACRAGTVTPFHFGDTLSTDQANYDGRFPYGKGKEGEFRKTTTPVGIFPANGWGLFDMHGNVWEWCQDGYGKYASGDRKDPQGDKAGFARVLRGGSWNVNPGFCRSAGRHRFLPARRSNFVGCRVVLCLD